MDVGLITEVEPSARKAKVGTFAGMEVEDIAIKGNHLVELRGADVDVVEGDDGHGRTFGFGLGQRPAVGFELQALEGAMTREEFNTFCAGLRATGHVVQWGNADVWKVGGKVFALCGWYEGGPAFTFKVGDIAFEVLGDAPGIRPAPYLASRGMKWVQVYEEGALSEESLREHIVASWEMAVGRLTKKARAELGV